jgi:hypothetical protein
MALHGFRSMKCALALATAFFASAVWAAGPERTVKRGDYNPDHETVEMFSGIEQGLLEVKFIPKNANEGRVFIKNKSDKPLNVKLPDGFVTVLAQFGAGAGAGAGPGFQGGGGQGQAGGGGDPFGGGGGQNFFNVPAEKVGEIRMHMVCLEHGKPEPTPRMVYDIQPVEAYSSDPELKALLALFSQGKYSQRGAQVAAWHIASKMSWQELANKRIHRLGGTSYPYFSQQELAEGQKMAAHAKELAKEIKPGSPGEHDPQGKLSAK